MSGFLVVDPGGMVLANCGSHLTFTGILTNNGTMRAIDSSVLEALSNLVNNGVINVLNGGTNFHGAFMNNGVVIISNSVPVIITIKVVDANVLISFITGNTALYIVEYKTDLINGSWTTLTNLTGNGNIMTVADPGAAAAQPKRFYRARLVIPQ
jgi:hypothetical protein